MLVSSRLLQFLINYRVENDNVFSEIVERITHMQFAYLQGGYLQGGTVHIVLDQKDVIKLFMLFKKKQDLDGG